MSGKGQWNEETDGTTNELTNKQNKKKPWDTFEKSDCCLRRKVWRWLRLIILVLLCKAVYS